MKKIIKIDEVVITPDDIVARMVEFEDGTGQIQTFSRPLKKWTSHGLDAQSYIIAPGAAEEFLKEAGYTDEEIDLVFEGFDEE